MKTRYRVESDQWTPEGRVITTEENLEVVRQTVERAPIIVEHWLYRGSTSPYRLIFEDYEQFTEHLNSKAYAGDVIYVWNYEEVCRVENAVAQGKCPADDGCVPSKGAY